MCVQTYAFLWLCGVNAFHHGGPINYSAVVCDLTIKVSYKLFPICAAFGSYHTCVTDMSTCAVYLLQESNYSALSCLNN